MRTVPTPLQAHMDETSTSTCLLLKITTTAEDHFGLTTLDVDVEYDDGDGAITYVATEGFNPSMLSTNSGLSVDNAEANALISQATGITEEMVVAGELDDATWKLYLVNFDELSNGHLLLDGGDVGDVSVRHGLLWIPELISRSMRLKQPIGTVWSLRCRAIFGSPADSPTGCGVDIAGLWVTGEVQSVGAENNREFTGDDVSSSGHPVPFPGRLQFLTGDNAGREYATEAIDSLTVTLAETTPYPITAGDTYRIRPDCKKRFREDCIQTWDNGLNFKGEPHIPLGDAAASATPAAQTPNGSRFARGSN